MNLEDVIARELGAHGEAVARERKRWRVWSRPATRPLPAPIPVWHLGSDEPGPHGVYVLERARGGAQ